MYQHIKVRLLVFCSLIFSFCMNACRNKPAAEEIVLGWDDKQVRKILVPIQSVSDESNEMLHADLKVRLAKPGAPEMLGTYSQNDEFLIFEPLIPFARGLKYEVLFRDKKLADIEIPAPDAAIAPVVKAIYPSPDSLPENLLKIYIAFSQPMQEGVSASQVALIKEGNDTLSNVFLDLQPELWNNDRTILTLWLNPGRIKRDLGPNRELGPPLLPGQHYQILIKPGWQDAVGGATATAFQKNFLTMLRDTLSPDVNKWNVQSPKEGTLEPVKLHLYESLDYQLLKNAFRVMDENMNEELGRIEVADRESTWRFVPFTKWKKGKYQIMVEPRVEDLAGNNLERLFDVDLAKPASQAKDTGMTVQAVRVIYFQVR